MLRRSLLPVTGLQRASASSASSSSVVVTAAAISTQFPLLRFGGGGGGVRGPIDHSASMLNTNQLTKDMKQNIDAQANRTVADFVPGKLFMRHWIAGVQAFESIYNRILALLFTLAIIVFGSVYASNGGLAGLSVAPFSMFVLFCIFLPYHTHHLWHGGVLIAGYLVCLQFGLLG